MDKSYQARQTGNIKLNAAVVALLWTLLVGASLFWNVRHQQREMVESAHLQADAFTNKDLSFRSWASAHGGVYVRPDAKTPSNPYLNVPDKDVVTTTGIKLTLMNPAYMMRQVLEDFSSQLDIRGHLTSLKLTNPHNAPDPWEREALLSFEQGAKDRYEVMQMDGRTVLRHMRPVYIEPGCLSCHADTGYKLGDIRGGISTVVNMEPLKAVYVESVRIMSLTHGLVWLVGLLGIGVSARHFTSRALEREGAIEALRRNEQRAMALLALDEKAEKMDEKTLLQEGLEEAERLTSSQIAFLHFINDDQETIQLVTWSRRTREQCEAVFNEHYPMAEAGVWADCARLKRPVMHNDYQSLPNKRGYPEGHSHLVRELVVPVVEGDKVRLIMGVGNKESNYDQTDQRLLQMIANDLWKVVRRRRADEALRRANEEMEQRVRERTSELSIANDRLSGLVGELRQHQHELRLINQLNDLMQSCQTVDEAYRVIEISLREIFSSTGGMLTMMGKDRQYLEKVVSWGDTTCYENFAPEDCWAMRQGHTHWVADVNTDLLCRHFSQIPSGGYLCLPLIAHGEIMGMLHIEMKEQKEANHYDGLRSMAATVGESIKLGLSNIILRTALREQATHDPLTGLYNRRYLDETLPREVHRVVRNKLPLCAVMMDIDYFKPFNDTYGHEAGDMALRTIGKLLRDNMRKSDIAVRYGGEEITIIMPDSSLDDARQRVEEIRMMIGQMEIPLEGGKTGQITISAGVAQMQEEGATPDQLLRAADQALYTAKAEGRNRVVVSKS